MVPNGWSQETLEDLSIVERGKFSARPRNDPRYFGGEMPFVQTGDVTGSKTYLNSFTQTLNQDGIGVSKVFPKGTILITIAANIGDTAITSFDVACPDSVVAIQPYSTKADTYWLKNVLDTKKEDLDSQSTQNAQKNINLQVLKPLVILTPPLSEQKKIAKILSTWDKAISTAEQLLANSQQQKKALMQQLLTGKKRLSDDKEWQKMPLEQVAEIRTGVAKGKTGLKDPVNVPYLRVANVQDGYINLDEIKEIEIERDKMDRFSLKKGDVLMNEGGDFDKLGRGDVWQGQIVPCLHQNHVFAVRPDPEVIDSFFLAALAASNYGKTYFLSCAKRSTNLASINSTQLKKFPVLVPSLKEQKKIAAVLTVADQEITILQQKLAALKQEKQALMQQLLTGKRRVKVEEAA